jgi:hypothetical protein
MVSSNRMRKRLNARELQIPSSPHIVSYQILRNQHDDSTIQGQAPNASPLGWIDENERRENSQKLKYKVRSHVRRGSHARQRRLNEAARPRPLMSGPRRIVQKGSGSDAGSSQQHYGQYSDPRSQSAIPPHPTIPTGFVSSMADTPESRRTPALNNQIAPSMSGVQPSGSVYFPFSGPSSQRESFINSPSGSSPSRQQFTNSEFSINQHIQP